MGGEARKTESMRPDNIKVLILCPYPKEFTIFELAEKVIKLTGLKSKIVFKPLPSDGPTQRQPDITRARDNLMWQPSVPLEEGLVATIDYFKHLLK